MYIKVKTVNREKQCTLIVSKCTRIPELKKIISYKFKIDVERQRLFYKGKQLENNYALYDYDVRLNDVIQLMEMTENTGNNKENYESCLLKDTVDCESPYYKLGDHVDIKDENTNSWFEGKIVRICKSKMLDDIVYDVKLICFAKDELSATKEKIRPISEQLVLAPLLKLGETVLVNYNLEQSGDLGFWYDYEIKQINKKFMKGNIILSADNVIDNIQINVKCDIYKIRKCKLITDKSESELIKFQTNPEKIRIYPVVCSNCNDIKNIKCYECGCSVCGEKKFPDKIIICDECNCSYHIYCHEPKLEFIPENNDDWYCSKCKINENEIVKAGDELKVTKKKILPKKIDRDWGNGMACAAFTKQCTIVPLNHFGPIPGIEVGATWKYRIQVAEAGVHRLQVGGIHGRENEGAYSIVLSGGYEDDIDNGDEFIYTGSGGRDLSGNKRTAFQSCDQVMERMNKALGLNCNAPLNLEKGTEANDWKSGKPVRVVRSYKLGKHSKYAPKEGNRYDGLYKVVKYYPETGKSGFKIWRYVLRRDDPTPAPWTEEGKFLMKRNKMEIILPDGYEEAVKENTKISQKHELREDSTNFNKFFPLKKSKTVFSLSPNVENIINQDIHNNKIWNNIKKQVYNRKENFLKEVEQSFVCICCQELVFEPVTLNACKHNICQTCLKRSFAAEVYTCPYCRADLGKFYKIQVNSALQSVLSKLFPGYEATRKD